MADEVELLVVAWKGWGIQVIVLLSFTVQVTLLLLADIRRQKDSTLLKFIIWSAYMLADTTAIYALGHMSLVSRSSPEQQLIVLWAPLLLVHLGGQDNITAYVIEDNRLWLRHLQTFGLQVLATAYVLYSSSILGRRTLLRPAAILIFVAGVLKYGERVWALMCASNSASSSLSATSYKDFRVGHQQQLAPEGQENQKDLLFIAYSLLDVPKQMFEGPTRYVKINTDYNYSFEGSEVLEVVRMQLSMMYDLLYTKAAVIHTWYGRCIRVVTLPATAVALLLFHGSSDKDAYRRVDVVVTYVLLGGAVVLETTSVLRAMFSRWTYAFLLEKKSGVWLSHVVRCGIDTSAFFSVLFFGMHTSGYMGQHNWFQLCAASRNNKSSKIARWMGREDWWDSMFYSWPDPVPEGIIERVVELVSTTETGQFDITNSRGRNALRRHSSMSGGMTFLDLEWSVELDLDESILVWHIATHIFIAMSWFRTFRDPHESTKALTQITEALPNYMFFLLAARPHMLPYPVSRQRYVHLCYDVINHMKYNSAGDLQRAIGEHGVALHVESPVTIYPQGISANQTLDRGAQLAASMWSTCNKHQLDHDLWNFDASAGRAVYMMIVDVWAEMLCYTAYWCNESSHAKHLSSGGEIMTTISLLMTYSSRGLIDKKETAPDTPAADNNV